MKNQWGFRLKVRQVRGVLPTILLKNSDGQTQRTLNIEKWDTDTGLIIFIKKDNQKTMAFSVTEFLNDVLQQDE